MTSEFSYSTSYTLDKSHFQETFDESGAGDLSPKAYIKSLIFSLVGAGLLFTEVDAYLGWFILAIGMLEALSVRFKRPWWVTRQMLSRAANSELTLTIDNKGVKTKSFYVDSALNWQDLTQIEETEKGWLLFQNKAKFYLSNRCLSEQAIAFLKAKQSAL